MYLSMPLYLNLVQKDTNGNIKCSILLLSHELKAEITFTGSFSLLFVINIIDLSHYDWFKEELVYVYIGPCFMLSVHCAKDLNIIELYLKSNLIVFCGQIY